MFCAGAGNALYFRAARQNESKMSALESGPEEIVALCLPLACVHGREILRGFAAEAIANVDWDVRLFSSVAEMLGSVDPESTRVRGVAGIFESIKEVAAIRSNLSAVVVSLAGNLPGNLVPVVSVDEERQAALAADHLLSQGLAHFAFCGVADQPDSEAQWRGFRQQVSKSSQGAVAYWFPTAAASIRPSVAERARLARWLSVQPRPFGLLIGGSGQVGSLLQLLRALHLQVPQDVALVSLGRDETDHLLSPISRSHVVPPSYEIGVRAARLLAVLMAGRPAPSTPVRLAPIRLEEAQSSNLIAVSDRNLESALRFIRTRFAEGITVAQVARHCGLARRTLEKRFRALLKRSPKEEIDRARIVRIRELLARSDEKLESIARDVGLQNAKHLSTFFSKHEGMPPSEFRRVALPTRSDSDRVGPAATALIPGFEFHRVRVGDVRIACEIGGHGPPLLLLHGFPQDRLMWRKVAPDLARTHTVVCADLRGYGDSDAPVGDPRHEAYSKRAMAQDQVALMRNLGFDRFTVIGHDRGGRVGHRMALDHPDVVAALVVMDIVPTATVFETAGRQLAHAYYHWFFLSQPFGLPERLLGADPGFYVQSCLERWSGAGISPFGGGALEHYRARWQSPERIHGSCEDYRAAATIDLEHDRDHARNRIACPLLVLWGAESLTNRLYDVLATWKAKAIGPVFGERLACGHFIPEENPEAAFAAIRAFVRPASKVRPSAGAPAASTPGRGLSAGGRSGPRATEALATGSSSTGASAASSR